MVSGHHGWKASIWVNKVRSLQGCWATTLTFGALAQLKLIFKKSLVSSWLYSNMQNLLRQDYTNVKVFQENTPSYFYQLVIAFCLPNTASCVFFKARKDSFWKTKNSLPKHQQASFLRCFKTWGTPHWVAELGGFQESSIKKSHATSNTILSYFLLGPYLYSGMKRELETRNIMTLWLQKVFLYFNWFHFSKYIHLYI